MSLSLCLLSLSVCLYLAGCQSIHPSACLSVCLIVFVSVLLSLSLYLPVSVCQSVCLVSRPPSFCPPFFVPSIPCLEVTVPFVLGPYNANSFLPFFPCLSLFPYLPILLSPPPPIAPSSLPPTPTSHLSVSSLAVRLIHTKYFGVVLFETFQLCFVLQWPILQAIPEWEDGQLVQTATDLASNRTEQDHTSAIGQWCCPRNNQFRQRLAAFPWSWEKVLQ